VISASPFYRMNHIAMLIRNLADRMLALFLLKHIPKSYILLWTLLTLPSKRTLQSISTVHFRTSIYARVFGTLKHSLQRTSRKDRLCCLKLDEVSVRENLRNRSLTTLRLLSILEGRAGHVALQTMLLFPLSVGCVKSGSNQQLTTSVVEVIR
jgi:hypothetical protein